jgi:glycosyltransferase involved in cell wall biosynthesis
VDIVVISYAVEVNYKRMITRKRESVLRLLVQIPCHNEELDIAEVIKSVPRSVPGFNTVDVLVIDDGSADKTVVKAIEAGANIVISSPQKRGLAQGFAVGVDFCLAEGYDVLVNTDGDNQYFQERISMLTDPILNQMADIVVGDRDTRSLAHFSYGKKILQKLGSWSLGVASGFRIQDGASGFRAYSRLAMSKLFVTTKFSYAMEVLVQAGSKGIRVSHVVTGAKLVKRPSRLFKGSWSHVRSSGSAIAKSYLLHRPLMLFGGLSVVLALVGLVPFVRYLVLTLFDTNGDHVQSLIIGAIFMTGSLISASLGVLAQLSKTARELIEGSISKDRLSGMDPSIVLENAGYSKVHDSRK